MKRRAWATPDLEREAFHGPAGTYALACQRYTEAAPVGVLVSTLVAFGNAAHRGPHMRIAGTAHRVNEFALLVGPTSIGRKGEAMNLGKRPIEKADKPWADVCVCSGFGSGEAVVDAVRDERTEIGEEGEQKIVDPGGDDKRLLVDEDEFAQVLAVAGREGSTLSSLVRRAWDGRRLENRTKGRRLIGTNAHVSVLAGITPMELFARTPALELANGFLNRFLLVAVRRTRLLADPPLIPPDFDEEHAAVFARALDFAGRGLSVEAMRRDRDAQALWREVYGDELSVERFGIAGAVCSRAEAHAVRLSMLYALLDESTTVRVEHLQAALALWRYCERSALLVFGERLGDEVADAILDAVRQNGGLTRDDVVRLFSGHRSKSEIDVALSLLVRAGRVAIEREPTGGRPVTRVQPVNREGEE